MHCNVRTSKFIIIKRGYIWIFLLKVRWTFGTGKRGKPRQRLLWQQVQNIPNSIIIKTKVLFKTVKQGTCFSPMWRRLERWWRNWGRYCEDIYILSIPIMVRILMTMQKKSSKNDVVHIWPMSPCQVALVWDDMLRTVPLTDIKVKADLCRYLVSSF